MTDFHPHDYNAPKLWQIYTPRHEPTGHPPQLSAEDAWHNLHDRLANGPLPAFTTFLSALGYYAATEPMGDK